MAHLVPFSAPLSINPLKLGQSIGASLAFLGLADCMPLQHGSRGCTSFNKLMFMRHFREPIPLQTTAMELTSVVMGADANVVEALKTLCERHQPALIGLSTTGLTATQGASLSHSIREFRQQYPQYTDTGVIPVDTCDSLGGLEAGYALALKAIIQTLVQPATAAPLPGQITVLVSPLLTPADVEVLKSWIESYGLTPILLPDLAESLDGRLTERGFNPLTQGGTQLEQIRRLARSQATLVIGNSLHEVADELKARTGVPDYRFSGLHDLQQVDACNLLLSRLSCRRVPAAQRRSRRQLLDALLDCQFRLGVARVALAAESDWLFALSPLLHQVGAELVVGLIPSAPPACQHPQVKQALAALPCDQVSIGDLGLLADLAARQHADVLVSNSHALELAAELGIGLLPAGYPLHRHAGGHARQWIGYAGGRQTLYDIDNLLARHPRLQAPYQSRFWPEPEPRHTPVSPSGGEPCYE